MIRWIDDNLGTAPWEQVATVPDIMLLDVRDMVDKEGNNPALIQSKIKQGVKALEAGHKVVVCCDYGISRSNAVAAGVLAVKHGISFYDSLRILIARTGEKSIKIEMMHAVADVVKHLQQGPDRNQKLSVPHILITGSSGYIGNTLLPYLQEHFPTTPLESHKINLATGALDLDLEVQQCGASHLIHLASPQDFGKNSAVGESINMLKNVLDVCSVNGLKLFFVSSSDVFSNYTTGRINASESLVPAPRNSPGVAKYLCETLIQQHAATHDLEWAILRTATLYGGNKRRPKFLHTFIEKCLGNNDIIVHHYRNGRPEVDLLHIDDFCKAFVAVVKKDFSGIMHLGSGSGIATRSLVDVIQDITGSHCNVIDHMIDIDTSNVILDCSLAATGIKWQPSITLREGIEALVQAKLTT